MYWGDFAIFSSHLKIYKSVGQIIDTKDTKCTLQSCTLTLCMRTMSPFWKILGWSSSFSQKMVQPIFSLDWSVIFRVEQKSVKRELYDIRKKCLVYHKNNSAVSETRTISTSTPGFFTCPSWTFLLSVSNVKLYLGLFL